MCGLPISWWQRSDDVLADRNLIEVRSMTQILEWLVHSDANENEDGSEEKRRIRYERMVMAKTARANWRPASAQKAAVKARSIGISI